MPGQPALDKFHNDWNQTAAWAQSKGVKYNQYLPIYQQDTQNFLQYGYGMSQAERERAIQAVANPNQATQLTPSTASNPANVIGNTITDARNIFTGLGDIVAHPLHNGLVDSVKNSFDLLDGSHKLTGSTDAAKFGDALTSTVLSWIPGVSDVGTVLQADPNISNPLQYLTSTKGLSALADHPLQSVFDILPFAKPLHFVSEEATAARFGADSVEAARKLGPIRTLKGYVMSTATKDPNVATGEFLTIGDKFHQMTGGSILNLNPAIHDAMSGGEKLMNHYSNVKRALLAPLHRATQDLTPEQGGLIHDILAKSEQVGLDKAMEGVEDPKIISVLNAWAEHNQWVTEESLNATDGIVRVRNIRTGQTGYYSLVGHASVLTARDAADAAENALLEKMPEAEQLIAQTQAAGQFVQQSTQALEQANGVARQTRIGGQMGIELPGARGAFKKTPFSRDAVAKSLFDTGGWVDRLVEKAKAGEYESVEEIARDTLKRLDAWGVDRVDTGELGPEFQAVRSQVERLQQSTKALLETRRRGSKMAYGSAKEWTKAKPARDAMHRDAMQNLESTQSTDRAKFGARQREQLTHLRKAYALKRGEIKSRYAKARSDREHTLVDGTRNINERYALEKAKLQTRHLLARETHQEWLRGRRAQGLPGSPEVIQGLQEGSRIQPGALGSTEAIQAGTGTLEAARRQEISDLEASLPSKAELTAKEQAETRAARLAESDMTKRLKTAQMKDENQFIRKQEEVRKQLEAENLGKKGREGDFAKLVKDYYDTQNAFSDSLFRHPSDNFQPVWFNLFAKNLIEDERMRDSLRYKHQVLAEKYGWTDEHIEQLHGNQQVMATLVQLGLRNAFDDPIFDDFDQAMIKGAQDAAYKNIDDMAKAGLHPQWVHHVSGTQLKNDATGSSGIRLIVGNGIPKPNVLNPRVWGLNVSKFDVMAAVDHPTRQFLARAGLQDYVSTYLDKRVVTARQVIDTMLTHFPDESAGLSEQGLLDLAKEKMKGWNLQEFDPADRFGFRLPRWKDGKVYLDADLLRAVEKLSGGDGLFKGGLIEKGTKLFRYSILGLSPRYTAHIIFGGSFLLAMREPLFFMHIPEMLTRMKEGNLDENLFTAPTSQMGTSDWQMISKQKKLEAWHSQVGKDTAHYLGQEHIEKKQGIPWKQANPVHWLKAMADINLHFTTTVVHMQKGLSYLTAAARAEKKGYFYENGERVEMTQERMAYEGMKATEKVFGDLRSMSPFERDVARTVMPFYGWQKHILQYVFTFPADHPWRTMMLANMAEYDTSHSPGGLPSRYQFLFFLGAPDAQGNVTAIDTRAVNPLRDVANYATWGGLISGLNPLFTAGFAAVDPQIIYGGNTLYPNLTYDQFYGISEAGPQGSLLTAAEQVVPQIGGMQSALQLAGQRQGMSDSQLIKSIGNQMNFPWVPQTINLNQETAKTALAQYRVTSNLASTAWQSGNFQPISDLGSVPDPRNPDYEIPVSQLEQLYNTLASEYPGVPPSTVATPPPSVHL